MACSWDRSVLADPDYCDYANGSTIYCDTPLNCACNATIKADSDIAGSGVYIAVQGVGYSR